MALYDYGNTRLRARLSNLQTPEKLESYADLNSVDSFVSTLTKTPYKESIEEALTYAHGYSCVNQAMKIESANIVQDLNKFYQDEDREMINAIFLRYDLQNIKTIVRGVIHKIPLDEITSSFSSLSTIPDGILNHLVKSENLDDLIDRMVLAKLPVALVLLELRARKEELTSADIELVLEKWYFNQGIERLRGNSENVQLMRDFYAIEADLTNLNTILRVVESDEVRQKISGKINDYLIDHGSLSRNKLINLIKNTSVDKMIRSLFPTKYGSFLRKGLECFSDTGMLSEFENQMRMYMLSWLSKLPRLYPLGIGVPLGYVARKRSEVRNIRWIAKGISSGFDGAYIKENLERIQ